MPERYHGHDPRDRFKRSPAAPSIKSTENGFSRCVRSINYRAMRSGGGCAFFVAVKQRGPSLAQERQPRSCWSPGKHRWHSNWTLLVDLVLSLSHPPPSKKGRECQSYIRELLGTPNKLAEHVSQNRGYLAGLASNPLDSFPSRSRHLRLSRRVLSLPRLFIVLFASVSLFFFFQFSLALSLPLSPNCLSSSHRGNNPRCISRPRGADGYCFTR